MRAPWTQGGQYLEGEIDIRPDKGGDSSTTAAASNAKDTNLQTGAGGANTGGGATGAGGAGGDVTIALGAGGATNNTGSDAGGAGGAVTITSGAGGAASAGTGEGGAGGAVTITAGAAGASTGGSSTAAGGSVVITSGAGDSSGNDGAIRLVGLQVGRQAAPAALTTSATLTIAQLLAGIVTGTHSAGGTQTYTLPTGTLMSGGTEMSVGDYFDWTLINLSAAAADTLTVAVGATHTVVGGMVVQSQHATTGALYGASATFRSRMTAATTWVTYRIS